ncbi:hypothetical protein VTI74DRAFT_1372 [Chaetomium olivicolor]
MERGGGRVRERGGRFCVALRTPMPVVGITITLGSLSRKPLALNHNLPPSPLSSHIDSSGLSIPHVLVPSDRVPSHHIMHYKLLPVTHHPHP